MEAIPEATIVENASHNGGRPNRVFNPEAAIADSSQRRN